MRLLATCLFRPTTKRTMSDGKSQWIQRVLIASNDSPDFKPAARTPRAPGVRALLFVVFAIAVIVAWELFKWALT